MTVSSTTNRKSYVSSGSTGPYAFPYKVLVETDLVVQVKDQTTGVITTKTITTHYTVSGTGNRTGSTDYTSCNVTFLVAPTSGDTVIIYRDPGLLQSSDYVEYSTFPAETLERDLDKHTLQIQKVSDELSRTAIYDPTIDLTSFDPTMPTPAADKYLKFNADASGLEAFTLGNGSGLTNMVDDTSPQLGGDLDVNSRDITSAGDVDVVLGDAAGTYKLKIKDSALNTVYTVNSDGAVAVTGPAAITGSTGASLTATTGALTLTSSASSIAATSSTTLNTTAGTTTTITGGTGATFIATTGNVAVTSTAGQVNTTAGTSITNSATTTLNETGGTGVTTTATTGNISLVSTAGDINLTLGDAAGSKKLYVKDSAAATVLTIDSDGKFAISATGDTGIRLPAIWFRARRITSAQSISSSTATKVQLNGEDADTNNNFDNATNYRHTPTKAGIYLYTWQVTMNCASTVVSGRVAAMLYLNGARVWQNLNSQDLAAPLSASGSVLLSMNGSTDYVELYAYSDGTSSSVVETDATHLTGCLIMQSS